MDFIPATQEHYSDIADLVSSPEELYLIYPSGNYPWDSTQLQALSENRLDYTTCLIDDVVAAFANLYNVTPNESAFIGNVIVSKSHRGKGVGVALTQYMIQICLSKYKAVPHLSVFGFNSKALLMYSQMGFKPYDLTPRKSLSGEDVALIHMRHEQKT